MFLPGFTFHVNELKQERRLVNIILHRVGVHQQIIDNTARLCKLNYFIHYHKAIHALIVSLFTILNFLRSNFVISVTTVKFCY